MSRDRDREKKRDQEDEEEAYERRKLERKLRDKEAAYQEVGKCIMFTLHHCECLNSECETCPSYSAHSWGILQQHFPAQIIKGSLVMVSVLFSSVITPRVNPLSKQISKGSLKTYFKTNMSNAVRVTCCTTQMIIFTHSG